jgi:uncharacterized protein
MKIYRKLIPEISKNIVRHLLAESAIEIEDGRREDAELDVAGVLVNYLNEDERLSQDSRELMERRGLPPEKFGIVKKNLAETRNIVTGAEAFDWVLAQLSDSLFSSGNIEEVFAEDHDLRRIIREAMRRYIGVDETLDKEVRTRLRHLREGTREWEIEYEKVIQQMRQSHGLG